MIWIGDPDYKLKCIGFWKENLRSYLITYDELDAFSRYRCWVYQRADLTKIYMSQALGPYCPLNQDVTSWNYTEGAAVHLNMEEYEREREWYSSYELVHCLNTFQTLFRWSMSDEFRWWWESMEHIRNVYSNFPLSRQCQLPSNFNNSHFITPNFTFYCSAVNFLKGMRVNDG